MRQRRPQELGWSYPNEESQTETPGRERRVTEEDEYQRIQNALGQEVGVVHELSILSLVLSFETELLSESLSSPLLGGILKLGAVFAEVDSAEEEESGED